MIWKLAGNRHMELMLDRIAGPMIALQARIYQPRLEELIRKETEARQGSHARIVAAICCGEPTKARLAMQKHVLDFWRMWLKQASTAVAVNQDSREAIHHAIDLVTRWESVLDPLGTGLSD